MTVALLVVAMTIAAVWGLGFLAKPASLPRAAIKTAPVALLALAAFLGGGPSALAAALALGALGDWLLAFEGRRAFLAGVAAFLMAHLLYAALFFSGQNEAWTGGPVFLGATLALFALSAAIYRRLLPHLGDMKIPVAFYCAAILAMAVAALSRGLDPVLLAGVALFMASDTALAYEKFAAGTGARLATRRFVWFSYAAAQALICSAFLLR
jgi:uncharacterized membrane protein YhhN